MPDLPEGTAHAGVVGVRRSPGRGVGLRPARPKSWCCWRPGTRSSRSTWWRYAAPAAGIIWLSRMCSARHARRLRPGARAARGRRATARARPVNNEGRHHQSSGDASGSETERVGKHGDNDDGARSGPGQRRHVPPDDRLTAIIPAVTDDRSPGPADPIDEVKAALGSAGRRNPCCRNPVTGRTPGAAHPKNLRLGPGRPAPPDRAGAHPGRG